MLCLIVKKLMKLYLPFIFFIVFFVAQMLIPTHSSAMTIAAIMSSDQPRYREAHRSFVKSLARHGYNSPATEIILHTAMHEPSSWSAEIHKLSKTSPDLIVTYGAPISTAAIRELSKIPIVAVDVFGSERTVKGMCGVSSRVSMITLAKTLLSIRPYKNIGVLYSPRESGSQQQLDDLKKVASQLGITLFEVAVSYADTLDSELNKLFAKSDAVVVTEGGLFAQQFEHIIARSMIKKIPVVSTMPDAAEKGAIVSLEINPREQGYLAAEIAVRVLEGAKPEYLPLVRPSQIDLVINMRKAREIGLKLPFATLQSATRLIK